jgi:phage-related protein
MLEEPYVYGLLVFQQPEELIELTPEPTKSKIESAFMTLRHNRFNDVRVKTLRGKIKEIIIKRFRFIFFIEFGNIYVVRGFTKKSNKTPIQEIEYAEKKHRELLIN